MDLLNIIKRDEFLSTYRLRQPWSLPDSIIYYITKNPSTAKCYQKLILSCKYFFIKNPKIIVKELCCDRNYKWAMDKDQIDFKKLSNKLWISDKILISTRLDFGAFIIPRVVPPIIPHIYQSDAKIIRISKQVISLKEFSILSSNVEDIILYRVTINKEDGSLAPLEKLVQALSKAKKISFYVHPVSLMTTSNTVKELLELPHFSKINKLRCGGIAESFDIDTFFAYIKTTQNQKFSLSFHGLLSDAYKNRVEAIIDEILGSETRTYKPPLISFYGFDREKLNRLSKIHY